MASTQNLDPVVIVGISLRFPQDAVGPTQLWDFLCEGKSALTAIPKDRFNADAFYHPNADHGGTLNSKGGHFIKQNISAFDAPFFSISPDEAKAMDPQQRMLLEVVYEGFENAGIPMNKFVSSRTACYVGAFTRDYETLLGQGEENLSAYQATGNGMAMLANRISWFYDLKGPSISLDTACSSSLTAFYLACQSLQNGEADMAVVAGANLFYNPDLMLPTTAMHFLSPDSKCYSFDHRANGYARGEGIGSVIIKRLSQAVRDGDTVRAVVRGTGVNQDGRTPGITLPSREAQETLIRETYAKSGLDLAQTRYFEAHGTGTAAGDPIEAGAIAASFLDARSSGDGEPLIIGAIKSNLGHLEGTSGLAGLIKTILVLEEGRIPANIWMEKVNPKIPAQQWKLKFPTSNMMWPQEGLRRASINSFGYGGANCHVILDDAYHFLQQNGLAYRHNSVVEPSDSVILAHSSLRNGTQLNGSSVRPKNLFLWSAFDQKGLERVSQKYIDFLHERSRKESETELLDKLSYTLSSKRTFLPWKSFSIASSIEELNQSLKTTLPKPIRSSREPRIGYIFTGQGAEWYGMGRELYQRFPVFANSLRAADKYIQESLGSSWSLLKVFLDLEQAANIHNPAISQSLCTALQVSMVELLFTWGVIPARVAGHSSGEIAAAFCAGAINRECAWAIAYYRGTVTGVLPSTEESALKGAMMAVGTSEHQAQQYIARVNDKNGVLVVACINSQNNVTISGDADLIDKLKVIFDEEGIFSRKLEVERAYHSPHMTQFVEGYKTRLSKLQFKSPTSNDNGIEIFSSVTGGLIEKQSLAGPDYWISNLLSQVRFLESVQKMCKEETSKRAIKIGDRDGSLDVLVEIGPRAALQGPTKQILTANGRSKDIRYLSMLSRDSSAIDTSLRLAGDLYCHGCQLDFQGISSLSQENMLVDPPSYAWNHENKYWFEGRTSKNYRFRKFPRHDLLGAPVADWNPLEPRWRNFLRVAENPWLKDHRITGVVLYPAAASLTMAIEASRQLSDPTRKITGYQIREVALHQALAVPETKNGVEIMLYMRPHGDNSYGGSNQWSEFHVCSYSEEYEWREHCRGLIAVEYESQAADSLGKENEAEEEARGIRERMKGAEARCSKELGRKQMYDHYESIGMQYGPTFQSITSIKYTANEAIGTIQAPDLKSIMPNGYYHKHVIHPIMLDNLLHFLLPAVGRGIASLDEPIIPTFIGELWVAATISTEPNYTFTSHASARWISTREARGSGVLMDDKCQSPQVILKNLVSKVVFSADFSTAPREDQLSNGRQIGSYNVEWKPDLTFMNTEELLKLSGDIHEMASRGVMYGLELMGITFMKETLETLDRDRAIELSPHFQKYVSWMREQVRRCEQGTMIHQMAPASDMCDRELLEKQVEANSVDGEVMTRIGRSLIPILKQQVDPLELLVKDNLLDKLYEKCVGSEALHQHLATYIDAATFKNPQMEILEIGAGTGAATRTILKALTDVGKPRVARYTYTDISAGFFDKAKEKFREWIDVVSFRILDIEFDPVEQGFEANKYDMLVASNVLHATASLDNTLENAKKLLKPGGKLVLMEITNPDLLRTPFSFGLLSGWWLSKEKNRSWGPTITTEEWNRLLQRHGFDRFDHVIPDIADPDYHQVSMMVSTYSPEYQSPETDVVIVTSPGDDQTALVSELQSTLERHSLKTNVISFSSITKSEISRKPFISLVEFHENLLHKLKEDEYEHLQHMIMAASSIVWVSKGGAFATESPLSGLSNGFGRVIRSEHEGYRFVKLDLEETESVRSAATSITKLALRLFTSPSTVENEYATQNGTLFLSRLINDDQFAVALASKNAKPDSQPLPFGKGERPLKLDVASPGTLSSLRFEDDEVYHLPLGPNEIEVKVKAVGLNFKDVMIAMGQLSDTWLGNECAGVVSRVGSAVKRQGSMNIGDRVCGVAMGSFRTFYRDDVRLFQRMPDTMSFVEGAAIPLVYCTAHFALFDIARLKKGESILIHAAAGGVGQAAIALARLLEAEIFVTVGTTEKKNFLMDTYGINEDHIFSSRDLSFAKGVMRMTKDRGVDVVLNSLSGEALSQSWRLMAPFGRFIEIGRRDIDINRRLEMSVFAKSATFASVAIDLKANLDLAGRIMNDVMQLAQKKLITSANPLTVFPFSKIEESFRTMQAGKHIGKIVLEPHDDDLVPALPPVQKLQYFDDKASYLISGGLGGLARSMVRWMVERNLKNVILCSRSGPNSEAGKAISKELKEKGVNAAVYACDVSSATQLASVLKDCETKMPPIKGCIQSAMVLRDSTFENMSYADFQEPLLSKVQGSWNLHNLLPRNLDFFIMLSSASGITGTRGQANYASGNTFQDALSHHRISQGLHSIAIDLGFILSVGYVAEDGTSDIDNRLHAWGFVGIREEEFLSMLEYCINPSIPPPTLKTCQVITGIENPALMRAKGLENPYYFRDPFFSHLRLATGADASALGGDDQEREITAQTIAALRTAASFDDAAAIIRVAFVAKLCKVLSIKEEDIDVNKPLHTYGVDSLVAVVIRYWLFRDYHADIAVFDIMGGSTIVGLSFKIAAKTKFVDKALVVDDETGDGSKLEQ